MSGFAKRRLAARRRLRDDFAFYAAHCLHVRGKAGSVTRFTLNAVQRAVHAKIETQRAETGRVRVLILKARQPGISTYVGGRFYWLTTHRKGVRAFILTHRDQATANLFNMAKRFHENCPAVVRPKTTASNANEMSFGLLDSGYQVGTAKASGVGRSDTIQLFHGSEVAFWAHAEEHAAGALQAVPDDPGTEIILESTANGIGGFFYNKWKAAERGEGGYVPIFIPWSLHDEYRAEGDRDLPPDWREYATLHGLTDAQAQWAYAKNAELAIAIGAPLDAPCWKFRQEYPATAEEAFQTGGHDSFIRSELVVKARKAMISDQSNAPLIFGLDTARGGGDKTRLIDRLGRCAGYRVNLTWDSDDEMELAGLVGRQLDIHRPVMLFIDVTGPGKGVYDRLRERGYDRVTGINFGARATESERYANKRAEMWGRMRDWFADPGGADIPEHDDALHSHLCAPGYRFDSTSRLLLEKKEDIKARVGFSPDAADALALTFAETVRSAAQRFREPVIETEYSILG